MIEVNGNIMKLPKYIKWIKPATMIISGLITLWVLFIFWTWLGPATFWQKVAGGVLSVGGGLVLFFFLQFLFMMVFGMILSKYLQKKMMQGFQMPQQPGMTGEGEGKDEEDSEDSMFQ